MIAKFNKKKKKLAEEKFFQIFFFVFCFTIAGFLIISNLKIDQKRKEFTERIKLLKEEVQILEEKKKKMEAGISQTEKETYWEERIREQGYVREGEEAIVIRALPKSEKKEIEQKNVWKRIWEEIKNFWQE